jgi:phage shock protein A
MNLLRGFFGLFISGLEKANPEALLEVEKENLRIQIARYNQGLASHAGLCERLMAQVKKLEGEQRDLRARTAANLRAGNRAAAAQYALRLQTIERELEENRRQLEQAETTYKELLTARDAAIGAARAKIEGLQRGLEDLKIKRAMAELTEMATGMISKIGGSGDTLDRLHAMVEDERTRAAGRARIARDSLRKEDLVMAEAEQKALADQALADFAAREGIALEATPGSEPQAAEPRAEAERRMGPAVEKPES